MIILYTLWRLFCNIRYTADSEYLVKTKGKKTVFRIPVKNIIKIYIGRDSRFAYFSFFLAAAFEPTGFKKTHGTNISIIFKECEILKKENHYATSYHIPKLSLKPSEYSECFEHSEILSLKKCMKICKIMGIEPEIVYYKKCKKKN